MRRNRHLSGFTNREIAAECRARGLRLTGHSMTRVDRGAVPLVKKTCKRCGESFTYARVQGAGRLYCDCCVLPVRNEQSIARRQAKEERLRSLGNAPAPDHAVPVTAGEEIGPERP